MAGMSDEMSWLLSQAALPFFLGLLLSVVCYRFTAAMGELQEKRPKKHQRRRKKGHARAFVLLKSSRLSRKCCSIQLEMESMYKTIHRFTRTIEDVTTYLDTLDRGMSERSNSSWTTITGSEDESCSKVSLSPLSDNSWNSIMARNVEMDRWLEAGSVHQDKQDLQIQLGAPSPTPEERDMEGRKMERPTAHHKSQNTVEAFNPEKKLQQKQGLSAKVDQTLQDATASASPSWQPQKACDVMLSVFPIIRDPPLLDRAVKRQLERHIVKMKIQRCYGLPTKVLEYERNFEDMALIQEAAQPPAMQRRSVLPYCSPFDRWDRCPQGKKAAKQRPGPQEESAGPVDTCPRRIPAPSAQPQKAHGVLIFPIVQDPPFLDRAAKRQLERHIVKMKIQRCYGLPAKVLEYERNFEDTALIQEAAQPPAMQRRSVLPYPQGKKAARQRPGPQKESADPVDTCSQRKQVLTQSGTAAFLGRPKEMAQQDRETPPWKKKCGELAGGSKTGKKTLPGTAGKEQGPGTQDDGHGPSLSGQAKWALPQSKGAPQGLSGQGSESPSISRGHTGPPELPLEKSIPMQEADLSVEGQSSSSEGVGTPELLSKVAAPLSRSSPQAQSPSIEKRPSALLLSPDSAGPSLLPSFLSVLTDYVRTKQAAVDLWNQLRLLWQQLYPDKAELPLDSHSPRGAQKGKRSAQDSTRSRRLCPQCSKAPHRRQIMICEFAWPQLQSAPTRHLPHKTVQVARI